MDKIFVIAKKEFYDSIKNNLFLVLVGFLLVLTITSIAVASFDFQNKVVEFNKAVTVLLNAGKSVDSIAVPQFFPLKMLRGVMDYLEIIGAIIGIILGYLSIAKEKGKNTLQLLLSRPLGKYDIVSGKILGNSFLIFFLLSILVVVIYFIMWAIGGAQLTSAEVLKLLLVFLASYVYIMFFFCLTSFLVLKFKSLPNALVVSFVIWLCFVLIVPQIGDTMDPDNQIPGGFFKSMSIAKSQEKEIMAKFHSYETARNAIEESSVTKHYERLSFALLGIKDQYNGNSIKDIFKDGWYDSVWVLIFFFSTIALEYFVLLKNNLIINKE
jgi:ABC-2 type transport system permease protein